MALATCTCADTLGVLLGEFTGLLTQFCLSERLGLIDVGTHQSRCPWQLESVAQR